MVASVVGEGGWGWAIGVPGHGWCLVAADEPCGLRPLPLPASHARSPPPPPSNDRHLRIWDAKAGALLWKFSGAHRGWITSLCVSESGEWLATTCKDEFVRVFAIRPRQGWRAKQGKHARDRRGEG